MIDYVKSNVSFIAILIVWLLVGIYSAPLSYGLIPLTVIIFKRRDYYAEILIGFFFILMISDSRVKSLAFSVDVKNIYILLLAVFVLFDRKNFTPFQNFHQKYIPFFLVALFCIIYSPYAGTSFSKVLSYFLIILVVPNFVHKAYSVKGVQFFRELIFFWFCNAFDRLGFEIYFSRCGILSRSFSRNFRKSEWVRDIFANVFFIIQCDF